MVNDLRQRLEAAGLRVEEWLGCDFDSDQPITWTVRGTPEQWRVLFQQSQQAWQPFATAPTDGTEIIVYREDAGVFTAVYTYPVEEEAPDFDQGCWFTVGGEDLTSDPPSHWMPLPTGPDTQDQQPQQVVSPGHVVVPVEVLRQAILAAATAAVDAVHLPGNMHEVVPIIPRLVAIEAAVKAGTAALERRPTP